MLRTAHHTHASTINAEGLCTVASSVIRNRHSETHNETDTDGATQVQRHETDPGEPPMRLRAPGMHRVPSGDLLSNAVEKRVLSVCFAGLQVPTTLVPTITVPSTNDHGPTYRSTHATRVTTVPNIQTAHHRSVKNRRSRTEVGSRTYSFPRTPPGPGFIIITIMYGSYAFTARLGTRSSDGSRLGLGLLASDGTSERSFKLLC